MTTDTALLASRFRGDGLNPSPWEQEKTKRENIERVLEQWINEAKAYRVERDRLQKEVEILKEELDYWKREHSYVQQRCIAMSNDSQRRR